jgi:methionyl-tRNA formyltransferase
MEAGLDSGPVLAQDVVTIGRRETAGELHHRLAELGGVLLRKHLPGILAGRLAGTAQDQSRVSFAPKIAASDALLSWHRSAAELERQVRAFNPVPGARFEMDGETIKCFRAEAIDAGQQVPGSVIGTGDAGIDVACGEGALRLLEVQRPGRRRVSGAELARQLPLSGRVLDRTAD